MNEPIVKVIKLEKIFWEKRFRTDLKDIEGLAESMREKGVLQPITVAPSGKGTFHLLAGERRCTAAKLAGIESIPALIRPVEDAADAREIELYENCFREDFSWDEKARLVEEIDSLNKAKNLDWSLRKTAQYLGVGAASVSRQLQLAKALKIMPELATECPTEAEAFKTLKKLEEAAVVSHLRERQESRSTQPEMNYLRSANTNYRIGDTLAELVELRSNSVIHFIECDPPYAIDLANSKRGDAAESYNEVSPTDYPSFLKKLCFELYRVASKDAWMVFWFGPTHFTIVLETLRSSGWIVCDIPGIWTKPNGQTMHPDTNLANAYEPFFICRKGSPVLAKQGRSNVFDFSPTAASKKYHPTERPLPLLSELLNCFVYPSQIVLVPFLGSGATLRACYLHGALGYGWDLDPQYKDRFLLAVEEDFRALERGRE